MTPEKPPENESWQAVAEVFDPARSIIDDDVPDEERYSAALYIQEKLGWSAWQGAEAEPGQLQVIEAYDQAILKQIERARFDLGELTEDELTSYVPGETIQNWIHVSSGNLVGKTKLASGLFSHFFDCFHSIIYTFAPSYEQINDLLWKEIREDRTRNSRPGEVLETPRLKYSADHFARGRATNDSNSSGIERIQGQHHPYLMFILDEAEGIPDFVYRAIEGMDTGVVVIVLLLANPRTRSSTFHKVKGRSYVKSFRISTLTHPNVVTGSQVVPGAATREWITRRLESYCEIVDEHIEDENTFEIPWIPGKIFRPLPDFFWRVLGVAPGNVAFDTFCPVGRYEAAQSREPYDKADPTIARLGADVARYGDDAGTLYINHAGTVWKEASFAQKRTTTYARKIKESCKTLVSKGVKNIHVRIDAGGGFGGGIDDYLIEDGEIYQGVSLTNGEITAKDIGLDKPEDHPFYGLEEFVVFQVHNGSSPYDDSAFFNLGCEMYYHAAEALRVLRLESPPEFLEADLCERPFGWKKLRGVDVKILVDKEKFRKKFQRSPDDGDGLALAVAPDYLFRGRWAEVEFIGF